MKISGNVVSTNMKRPDFHQTNERKSDYIKNNPLPIITPEDEGKVLRVQNGKLVADGRGGITKAAINENYELVFTYVDGTSDNLGVVVGATGAKGDKGEKGDAYILTQSDIETIVQAVLAAMGETGGTKEKQYLHTIVFENDNGDFWIMTLINNSPASLSGYYEYDDTDIYNGAIIHGYESNGAVVMHWSNGGGGSCSLELEDGTVVNSYYGDYTDTVTECDSNIIMFYVDHMNGSRTTYTAPIDSTWSDFMETTGDFIEESGSVAFCVLEGETVLTIGNQAVNVYDNIMHGHIYHCGYQRA